MHDLENALWHAGFEKQFGPIREVRFKFKPDGTRDGSVHQLWVVRGIKTDPTIPHCAITQPDFAAEQAKNNLSFRIPLQLFGLGLIDSIQDREILGHHAATASFRAPLGIEGHPNQGHPNRSGNDNTITRFGWKAQNKSITMFAGEAYNVEMGTTNELFPTATEEDPACTGPEKPEPSDVTSTETDDYHNPLKILADWMEFQLLMRFIDAPQPDPHPSASAVRGRDVFSDVGCGLCHTPQMQTAPVMNSAVLQDRPVKLFSDLLVHHMGGGLADDLIQGAGRTSFARCRFGAWDSACSSCMMAAQATCMSRSRTIFRRKRRLFRRRKPMRIEFREAPAGRSASHPRLPPVSMSGRRDRRLRKPRARRPKTLHRHPDGCP